ncbi:ThiF family adenylyltransferase [Echinicola marina]|uniref:ThiF family adenylyltransferase n=1 Tax=Echinicola marina TaxID=2859768 RepID=UPI001CF6560D|nr:ThiF family adenylyltransferase [Echinicola marina]UCS95229.1 ThiF family adenylyltransferase [Echinicola marina]
MEMELFSTSLSVFAGDIENLELQDSLKSLEALIVGEVKILDWGNGRIAVPMEVSVDLPSLGNLEGLDIREVEPIILVFDLLNYPFSAPQVFTDRLDFPKNNLAHLYIAVNNRPPAFCYVRGNNDEWYANKRVEDLVVRISNWLRDAAVGELTEDGKQFDPLRLEGYSGTVIYDYDTMLGVITGKTTFLPDKHLAMALFDRPKQTERCTYKLVKLLTSGNALETIKDVDEERKKNQEDITRRNYHYGYIIWGKEGAISNDYYVNLPRNWKEFKSFCDFYGVDYNELENFIATCDGNTFVHFPVIVGIRRPRPLIGYSSDIEFINFRFWVNTDDVKDGTIVNNISIDFFSHNQPLTRKQASQMSNCNIGFDIRTVVFGCGALGSKAVMHLARAGHTNLTLIDPDHISPHNLVRHALFGEDEGANKAVALAERIKSIYPHQTNNVIGLAGLKKGIIDKKDFFEIHNWVLDFTASEAFFNKLSMVRSMDKRNVASASISDFGNLGILYKEGESRNPRIDDLQAYLYSLSVHDKKISNWLQKEQQISDNHNVTVRVGIGCNSETTILPDDKISAHASYFSGNLKREILAPSEGGKIYLSRIEDSQDYNIETQVISVMPFEVFKALNNPSWMIRFKDGVIQKINEECVIGGENETGGVFVGICNYKTKTIHVVDSISAPIDSKANPIHFVRGHKGLSEEITKFKHNSGEQIGYIGEWHSHPEGPNALSQQDMESVHNHKTEFIQLNPPLPVFLSIITPDGLFPFVF